MAAKSTTTLLTKLRSLMSNKRYITESIQAYIIPTDDAHMSEYVANCEKRREFICGFAGSAGTAIVTEDKAAMWTDGRYFLQASQQMDSNWTLMKTGLDDTPSQGTWLCEQLPPGSRVGIDPFLMSAATWEPLHKELDAEGLSLVPIAQNLIDLVWEDQPNPPQDVCIVQPVKYAGRLWHDKVEAVREKMEKKKAGVLVVTALDEVAWLLNLRGSDIDFNPCFYSYLVLTADHVILFVDEKKVTSDVEKNLQLPKSSEGGNPVAIKPYSSIKSELADLVEVCEGKVWISKKSSQALYSLVPEKRRLSDASPVALMKAVKNKTEIQGMKDSHVRDAVALCEYFCWLEKNVPKGKLTEITAANQLQKFREQQDDYVSLSFETISSIGPNGAVIHYRPSEETDRALTTEEVYLCDSGAQFRDGTTDVTRTMHFGTPTKHQQECFTRVLKGHISLASVIFPKGVKGLMLDTLARKSLWDIGLDYLHGTGHGVGAFLNVHEGPCGISYRVRPDEAGLEEGMILSDEPGYYEDGEFGIRIESLVVVKKADTKHNFKDKGYLTFEPITLVPIQRKMIIPTLLTEEEIEWLNNYHSVCRTVVGEELKKQGRKEAYEWLLKETEILG